MFEPVASKAEDTLGELWGVLCPDAGPDDYDALVERAREVVRQERRLREALAEVKAWGPLNPPAQHICVDFPWLRKLVDDALQAV